MVIKKGTHIKPYKCRLCGEDCPSKFTVGYRGICAKCNRMEHLQYQRSYYKKWYAENGRKRADNYKDIIYLWHKEHPESVKTAKLVRKAIKDGLFERPLVCALCGKGGRINGHHEDYNSPYDVMWVCSSCHKKIHLGSLT